MYKVIIKIVNPIYSYILTTDIPNLIHMYN